jgi:acyl-CoA synthetase (NDP forming)
MKNDRGDGFIDVAALEGLFNPTGIIFVGKIDEHPDQIKRAHRFGLPICYVNPKPRPSPSGDPVYGSLGEVPDTYNLAIIRVGAPRVADAVEDCARHGIDKMIVFSSGFSESGPEGRALEEQLGEVVRRTGVSLIGPNTAENALEPIPLPEGHRGGLIGLITHSGGQGRAIIEGTALGAGFSRWVALGNEVGVDLADMINYFAHDPNTAVIAAYVEGIKNGPKLRAALMAANAADKPVVMLKIGASKKGAEMAASHTGHLSGADAPVNGLFAQHGVTRVQDIDELVDVANLFAHMPAASGTRSVIYSYSGANVAIMSEAADAAGIDIPVLAESTQQALASMMPPNLRVSNPIDNGGQFSMMEPMEVRVKLLDTAMADPVADLIIFGISAAGPTPGDVFSEELLAWAPKAKKPVLAIFSSPQSKAQSLENAVRSGVPVFRSFRGCFQALAAYERYQTARPGFRDRPSLAGPLSAEARATLGKPGIVAAADAARLLSEAGINMAGERLVASRDEAVSAATELGWPVAMKLMSPAFPHKSDVGLLVLDIEDADRAGAVHDELVARAKSLDSSARIDGVLVQEQVGAGVEMIVGLTEDSVLGSSLTIGAGGIYAEILSDVSVRPLPVDAQDISEMIDALKVARLLEGARGARPADRQGFIDLALRVARLAASAGGAIAELDLNPVIVRPDRAIAVDALIIAADPGAASHPAE